MSQVTFHVNAPDKEAYTCRLLRKAVNRGAKVAVTGDPQELQRLDVALWTFAAHEFVPHCRSDAPVALVRASPVVLTHEIRDVPDAGVLLHLGGPPPEGWARFEKIIEVVGQGEAERQAARLRWKAYAGQGHDMVHHDVAQRGGGHD